MLPKLYGDIITQELDITGDLAQLLEAASNRDNGLPPPIDVEFKKVESTKNLKSCLSNENTHSIEGEVPTHDDNHPVSVGSVSEKIIYVDSSLRRLVQATNVVTAGAVENSRLINASREVDNISIKECQ